MTGNRVFLLGLALGVLIGAAGAWLLRPAPPLEIPADPRAPKSSETAALRTESASSREVPHPEPRAVERRAEPIAAGIIAGDVTDLRGKPVGGVEFRLVSTIDDSHERRTKSGSDGQFEFGALSDGTYRIEATLEKATVRTLSGEAFEVRPGATVHFIVSPAAAVPIRVLLPDGSQAATATIEYDHKSEVTGSWPVRKSWTRENPVVDIDPGRHELRGIVGPIEEPDGTSPKMTVMIPREGLATPLELQVAWSLGVEGWLQVPDEEEAYPFRVLVHRLSDGESADNWTRGSGDATRETRGSARFSFRDLESGRYVVGAARARSRDMAVSAIVEVGDRVSRQDLTIPPFDPARVLIVHAEGPGGEPLLDVGFMLDARPADRANRDLSYCYSLCHQPGEFWILPVTPSGKISILESGWDAGTTVSLVGRAGDFGPVTVALTPGQREVWMRFGAGAFAVVSVVPPPVGMTLFVLLQPQDGSGGCGRDIGEGGVARLGPIASGDYELTVGDGTPGRSRVPFCSQTVRLADGENPVTVNLPERFRVAVSVPRGEPGDKLWLTTPFTGEPDPSTIHRLVSMNGSLNAERATTFENVPPGEYRLTWWRDGVALAEMALAVAGEISVSFEGQPYTAIRVTIAHPEGALGKAGFEDGDLIVGIDAREFRDAAEVGETLRRLRSGEAMTCLVLRRGSAQSLPISQGIVSADAEANGGRLAAALR